MMFNVPIMIDDHIVENADPLFVAYHDEEWGVPVHDDK